MNGYIKYKNNGQERREMLYYELICLNLPKDIEIVNLVSKLYAFGDTTLQCDFKSSKDIESNILKQKWIKIEQYDSTNRYIKQGLILDVHNDSGVYKLTFVDCQNDIIAYLYDLPKL